MGPEPNAPSKKGGSSFGVPFLGVFQREAQNKTEEHHHFEGVPPKKRHAEKDPEATSEFEPNRPAK